MKRVLLDHCVPRPFRKQLIGCTVSTANEMGWARLTNGALLTAAEDAGFEVLITSDKNLRYQQNLASRRIAIIELPTNRLSNMWPLAAKVNALLAIISKGKYEIVAFP
jgi:hypothetical protein